MLVFPLFYYKIIITTKYSHRIIALKIYLDSSENATFEAEYLNFNREDYCLKSIGDSLSVDQVKAILFERIS